MEKNKKYKVLSLDIWDTIIRRDCHPDEIKVMTAEYICLLYANELIPAYNTPWKLLELRLQCEGELGAYYKQKKLDDEYELHEVIKKMLAYALKNPKVVDSDAIEQIYQYELKMELSHTRLDPGIVKLISECSYEKLVVISDFYADSHFLKKILQNIDFPYKVDQFFISCESRYNKRSSNLFKYVQRELEIYADDQLHIGDNESSDVKIPQKLGIDAIHYLPVREHNERKKREQVFLENKKGALGKKFDSQIGNKDIAVFFTGFISWLAEHCLEKGLKKLYFFTREGEFYKQLFDRFVELARYKEELPKTYVLEVSRVATFLPSIREVTTEEMMRIWNQYSCQSMEAFFKSLRLDAKQAQKYTDKYGINYTEVLTYPWLLRCVQDLFKDKEFIAWMESEIKESKELFLDYCRERELYPFEHEKIGIVDIGWRGTIQDNLCYIFPEYHIDGFYIGLVDFLNLQPANSAKYGYINFNPKSNTLFHTLTPFEMICNSPNGSTVSYERTNGQVKAIRKKEKSEDIVYHTFTKKYQKNISDNMIHILQQGNQNYIVPFQYHEKAFNSLYAFCCYPDFECANAYFKLVHNEEFGVGRYIDKKTRFRPILMATAVFNKKKRAEFKTFLLNTTWPQGYLRKYHLMPLLRVYNYLVERYDQKK